VTLKQIYEIAQIKSQVRIGLNLCSTVSLSRIRLSPFSLQLASAELTVHTPVSPSPSPPPLLPPEGRYVSRSIAGGGLPKHHWHSAFHGISSGERLGCGSTSAARE
jgi:hypothetical protein